MKKIFCILICAMLLFLCACGNEAPVEAESTPEPIVAPTPTPAPEPTLEPTPTPDPEPETYPATVIVPEAQALLGTLFRGEEVEICGEWEDYYIIHFEEVSGLVEKRLLRGVDEPGSEPREGYARSKALCFPNYHMSATTGGSVKLNTKLTVLEEMGDCALVQIGEELCFMPVDSISDHRISGSGENGGGGGGSDGGDIHLGNHVCEGTSLMLLAYVAEDFEEVAGKAISRIDGAEVIAAVFYMDEEVRVLSESEDICRVWLSGIEADMERRFLFMENDTRYEEWTGYAAPKSEIFPNVYFSGDALTAPKRNAELRVLWDLGDCYMVEFEGKLGFMDKAQINEKPVTYSGGGGGSSSGGGDWTPPAM